MERKHDIVNGKVDMSILNKTNLQFNYVIFNCKNCLFFVYHEMQLL